MDSQTVIHAPVSRFVLAFSTLLIAILCCLKFKLIFTLNINWDEFYGLSQLYQFFDGLPHAGEANQASTSMMHLFYAWIHLIEGNEIHAIRAIRVGNFLLHLLLFLFLFRIIRKHLSTEVALFSILALSSYSFYITHGFSFRYDTAAIVFGVGALALIRDETSWKTCLLQALLFGMALALTIKSLIFFAFYIGLLLFQYKNISYLFRSIFSMALVLGAAIAFYLICLNVFNHYLETQDPFLLKAGLEKPVNPPANLSAEKISMDTRTFLSPDLKTNLKYFYRTLEADFTLWGLVLVTLVYGLITAIKSRTALLRLLALIGLVSPLVLGLLLYRNMYPYFYTMLIIPIIFCSAYGLHAISQFVPDKRRNVLLCSVMAAIFAHGCWQFYALRHDQTLAQVQHIDVIHKMFPEPVAYIDKNSMVSSFFKKGYFMSSAGRKIYKEMGEPLITQAILNEHPAFILANNGELQSVMKGNKSPVFFPSDTELMHKHYIHHWGNIYIAGYHLTLKKGETRDLQFPIQGIYTVKTNAVLSINGNTYTDKDLLMITEGSYQVIGAKDNHKVRIQWGDNIYKPKEPPIPTGLYRGL